MSSNCQFCGESLSFVQRMTKKRMHPDCKVEQDAITEQYLDALNQSSLAKSLDDTIKDKLEGILEQGKYTEDQLHSINLEFYQNLKDNFLEGADLTEEKREYLRKIQ